MRSMTRIAGVVVLLCAVAASRAEARPEINVRRAMLQSASVAHASVLLPRTLPASALVTLPPEDKPKTHWPWWLRILAVIGVLVFIRLVAGSMRNKPTGPPPM